MHLSNWDDELFAAQRTYAGLDAWIGHEMYRRVDKGSALGVLTTLDYMSVHQRHSSTAGSTPSRTARSFAGS